MAMELAAMAAVMEEITTAAVEWRRNCGGMEAPIGCHCHHPSSCHMSPKGCFYHQTCINNDGNTEGDGKTERVQGGTVMEEQILGTPATMAASPEL